MKNEIKFHPINQSILYGIKGKRQLLKAIRSDEVQLKLLCESNDNYYIFESKNRTIQNPKPALKKIHKRVADILSRIERPIYLHSATRGKSYITNAGQHSYEYMLIKIDIKKFFRSTRAQQIYHFFKDTMMCAPDISGLLCKILTFQNQHLATGSNVSPILSFFAYKEMFDRINAIAVDGGCTCTVYIDDIVISGPTASRLMMYKVRNIISEYRLVGHKTVIYKKGQPRVVTGVAITKMGKRVPNKNQKNINAGIRQLKSASEKNRLKIKNSVLGKIYAAAQIDSTYNNTANLIKGM